MYDQHNAVLVFEGWRKNFMELQSTPVLMVSIDDKGIPCLVADAKFAHETVYRLLLHVAACMEVCQPHDMEYTRKTGELEQLPKKGG